MTELKIMWLLSVVKVVVAIPFVLAYMFLCYVGLVGGDLRVLLMSCFMCF